MDQRSYDMAKAAYQQGEWAKCAATLSASRVPGEVSGAADHLRGNALMKMGLYSDAAAAYGDALADASYGKTGALSCNRGRAQLAAGDLDGAISSLVAATQDPEYPTPYKAYIALGNAQLAKGDPREAGIAFRNAAIDESNPDPSVALVHLGQCFLDLGRPVDAVEAYRTALDFSSENESQASIWASLGRAYVSANRMSEAVDAFANATADGTYRLTPAEQTASLAASNALAALNVGPSETDQMLADAGYGAGAGSGFAASYDPLDPTGASGVIMPSPEDTGFFTMTENEIVQQDFNEGRGKRHIGLKIFLVLLLLLVVAAIAAFCFGYGWPTQESAVKGLFDATSTEQVEKNLSSSLSPEAVNEIKTVIPAGATITINGIDRSMSESKARVTATLAEGGTQTYLVVLGREGIGWKVTDVKFEFDSTSNGETSATATATAGATAATSAA